MTRDDLRATLTADRERVANERANGALNPFTAADVLLVLLGEALDRLDQDQDQDQDGEPAAADTADQASDRARTARKAKS